MSNNTDITMISKDNLQRVVGGFGAGSNRDTRTDVLGGVLLDRRTTTRSDEAYKIDAQRRACERLHTRQERTWYGGTRDVVDHAAAARCLLDAMNPAPRPPAGAR